MQRRLDDAEAYLQRAHALEEEAGEWIWILSWHTAEYALWRGDAEPAERAVKPAYDALKAIGEKSHFSSMAQALALALCARNAWDEAEIVIRECRDAARRNDVMSQIMWRCVLAKLLAHKGELGEAKRFAEEAVDFASASDFHLGRAEAFAHLAEVLALSGKEDEAAAALAEAVRFHELKGNLLAAVAARSRLAEVPR
jgi:ATP/maltotriose-dependent transcriptional regulator MalT